jgi:hypothetical protein
MHFLGSTIFKYYHFNKLLLLAALVSNLLDKCTTCGVAGKRGVKIVLEGIVLVPALVMGIVIGLVEIVFVHADEAGMGWFMHAAHALPFTMFFVFVSMNISFVFDLLGLAITSNMWVDLGVRIVIGIIAMVKIASAAAVVGRVGEKWYHTLIIGVMIIVAPYVWGFLDPFVTPLLPSWLS